MSRYIDSLKAIIRRHEKLYSILVKPYSRIISLFGHINAKLLDGPVKRWKQRDIDAAKVYWGARNDNLRNEFLMHEIERLAPSSVLEVGCNCGNKLYLMVRSWPKVRFWGVDINTTAVDFGNTKFREEGMTNVKLQCLRAEDLSVFDSGSFDVVYSWATLIYPRPAVIKKILTDMIRIARHSVVLIEMQSEDVWVGRDKYGVYFGGNWKRDYEAIANEIDPSLRITIQQVSKDIWNPGGGGGAVIRIDKIPVVQRQSA